MNLEGANSGGLADDFSQLKASWGHGPLATPLKSASDMHKNLVRIGRVVPKINSQTDKHTASDRQTN